MSIESFPCGVDANEDEQQDGEAPQRGAAVAEEREGDADDRRQTEHHADVDEQVEQEDAYQRIAVDTPEAVGLPFGKHEHVACYY